jgi:hypothetical protein
LSNVKQIGTGNAIYLAAWDEMPASAGFRVADGGSNVAIRPGSGANADWNRGWTNVSTGVTGGWSGGSTADAVNQAGNLTAIGYHARVLFMQPLGQDALWSKGRGELNDPNVFQCPSANRPPYPRIPRLGDDTNWTTPGFHLPDQGRFQSTAQTSYSTSQKLTASDPANKVIAGEKLRGSDPRTWEVLTGTYLPRVRGQIFNWENRTIATAGLIPAAPTWTDWTVSSAPGVRHPFPSAGSDGAAGNRRNNLRVSVSLNHNQAGHNFLYMGGNARWSPLAGWEAISPSDSSENTLSHAQVFSASRAYELWDNGAANSVPGSGLIDNNNDIMPRDWSMSDTLLW